MAAQDLSATAARRINQLLAHLNPEEHKSEAIAAEQTAAPASKKSPDDIVLVASFRTPIGKAKRGSFAKTSPEDLLVPVIKHILQTTRVDPASIGDVVIGTVLPRGGQGATEVRLATLLAGLPKEVPCTIVNRQCSSGLQAIANVAAAIRAGYYDIGIAGGVESMSLNPMSFEGSLNEEALKSDLTAGCYMTMGQTSEAVAERFGISRKVQDEFSAVSHKRAAAAIKAGKFTEEIVPVTVKNADGQPVVVSRDEGVREDTTAEGLGKLKPAFKEGGSTTAGNSSQVSDGAAAALLMKRATAERLGLPVFGVLRSFAAVGVEPAIMGVGPAVAIPEAVRRAGLTLKDIDLYEINEAFASQATYSIDKLGLSSDKVNVNGGAIAMGHPLGATGARQTATLLHEMKRRGARYGVVSMCIGSGMGAAAVYERDV